MPVLDVLLATLAIVGVTLAYGIAEGIFMLALTETRLGRAVIYVGAAAGAACILILVIRQV